MAVSYNWMLLLHAETRYQDGAQHAAPYRMNKRAANLAGRAGTKTFRAALRLG